MALNEAQPGDILELRAGDYFDTQTGFVLPPKSGTDYITIRSSRWEELPPQGQRVDPSHADRMPKIRVRAPVPAIKTGPVELTCSLDGTADRIRVRNHGLVNGDRVTFAVRTLTGIIDASTPYYVRNAGPDGFQISREPEGNLLDVPELPGAQVTAVKVDTAHHYILRGLEVLPAHGVFTWYLLWLGAMYGGVAEQVPYEIHLDQMWVHGNQGENGPRHCVYVGTRDATIRNSRISECKDINSDATAIFGLNGMHSLLIENNYIEGATENIIFGGAYTHLTGTQMSLITLRRNHIKKKREWRWWMRPVMVDQQTVRFIDRTGKPCSEKPCYLFAATPDETKYTWTTHETLTSPTGSGTVLVYMTAAGVLTAQYGPASTFSSLTCSGNVMCEQSAGAPSWPENSTRLSAIAVADNAFKSVTRQTFIQKNLFEIKQARDVLLEGNVLEDQWTTDAGTYCALLFTPRSERGTVPQAAAENVIFRNNIVRNTMCGISMIGADDFEGGIYGVGRNLLFQNNLFEVVSTRRHGVSSSSEGMLFRGGVKFKGVELSHNTVVEIDGALASFIDNPGRDPVELHLKNNLVVPRAREEGETSAPFPVIQGTSTAGWRDAKTRFNPDGTLAGNVLLNRNNWGNARNIRDNYPTDSNYLMLPGESLASVCFKGYEHGDYRLCRSAACGTLSPFSAVVDEVRSTSGRDIGADIDEIEALTRGVVEGIPEFAQRAAVQVAVEGTKATLTWTAPSEEACRVQVYDSPEYKKLTSDVDPGRFENADLDSRPGVYADGLRRSFTIGTLEPLEPGKKYHYKLFCGSEIATGSFETQP